VTGLDPASAAERLLGLASRGLSSLPKLRDRQWVAHKLKTALNRSRASGGLFLRPYRAAGHRLALRIRPHRPAPLDPPRFPFLDRVDVSIIIPVFNHCRDTLLCLESIARNTSKPSYEVIVVDDASTDETSQILADAKGLAYLRNDQNLGFIASCNRGAAVARGDYLLFLNNDALVLPGWLEALERTFKDIPSTGLAGAKLLFPDGRLQEAGGVIWRDASGWNYGRDDDPDHPKYNFAREVDYCSGACVMVPRALFQRLGGYDNHYKPAYYEDTDLAFKIHHAGHKVIYQPLARIVHVEGLTAGRSLASGVKSYQVVNQAKFRLRWSNRLDFHPEPTDAPSRLISAHGPDQTKRGQILVIDHRLPTPDRDSGSVRMVEMLRAIRRRGHHICFVPDDLRITPPYQEALQGIGVEVIHHPYYRSVASFLRQHGRDFELAILCRADVCARHLATVRRYATRAKVVFDTVDLHFLREEREARLARNPKLLRAVAERKKRELRLVGCADLTLVVSPAEKTILEGECPEVDVRVLSNIQVIPESEPPGLERRRSIVFIGSFEHAPNTDAVCYFAKEVFPRVSARIPEAVFQVIGPDPPRQVRELAGPNIEVLGHVADVRTCFNRARVSVAPLRFGAGVKGKVNQSMALGVPTVVTSVAAEGMYLDHQQNALIADDPESFAAAVIQVWTSPDLWRRISAGGRKTVREHFSVEAASRRVDELLTWAGLLVSEGTR
jgi:GT2 family glycosyltransferase